MAEIKAIETSYQGYRFRSRLEARWAVFFDSLSIPWSYEPEGFDLGDGLYYLPDFWLSGLKAWYEIKATEPAGDDLRKINRFALHHPLYVAVGDIPSPDPDRAFEERDPSWFGRGYITLLSGLDEAGYICGTHAGKEEPQCGGDLMHLWCACRTGKHFDIHYEGRGDRIDCGCPGYEAGGGGHSSDSPAILQAYHAARSARFEHGETPRPPAAPAPKQTPPPDLCPYPVGAFVRHAVYGLGKVVHLSFSCGHVVAKIAFFGPTFGTRTFLFPRAQRAFTLAESPRA